MESNMNLTKKLELIYYTSTGLLTIITGYAIVSYHTNYEYFHHSFIQFGYPPYLIYPLSVLKFLGLLVIWIRRFPLLTSLAYAGFFYNIILGFIAHLSVGDNKQWSALLAFIFLVISFFSSRRLFQHE